MKVIDVHAHWMPLAYGERLAVVAASDAIFARRFQSLLGPLKHHLTSIPELVRGMDLAGVDISLLSVPPPAVALPSRQPMPQIARDLNEALMAAVGRHPDRLMTVLSLPLSDIDEACREVQRWADHRQLAGVSVPVASADAGIDVLLLEPLLEICADLDLPVFLHPELDESSAQFSEWNLHSAIGAPMATTIAAARLALSGVLDRIPELKIVAPHLGGALPFLFGRLVEQSSSTCAKHELSYYLQERLFYDTCAFHPPALHCAITTIGIERFLLGSDYPFRGSASRAVREMEDQLLGTAKDAVMGGNAQRLLMARTVGI